MEMESISLCKNLRLSADLVQQETEQVIRFKLENPIEMEEVEICQPIGMNTLNPSYHRREAIVIGMRRLMTAALDKSMIKVTGLCGLGVFATQSSAASSKPGQDIILFATDEE